MAPALSAGTCTTVPPRTQYTNAMPAGPNGMVASMSTIQTCCFYVYRTTVNASHLISTIAQKDVTARPAKTLLHLRLVPGLTRRGKQTSKIARGSKEKNKRDALGFMSPQHQQTRVEETLCLLVASRYRVSKLQGSDCLGD